MVVFPERVTLGHEGDPFVLRLAESANARSALVFIFLSRTP